MRTLMIMVALGLSAAVPSVASGGSIEEVIDREMPASGVPGLAYAVVEGGDITTAGARGAVRVGGQQSVTPDTPFLTGSISKSVTALCVMQLVEAGEIQLDAGLSRYLDAFSNRGAGAITVRQLLSHTSGYSTLQGNTSHADSADGTGDLARHVDTWADVVPAHAPDQQWEYSNTNYQILGRVVEVVSGQDYQSYVAENVLDPLGMENSVVADGDLHGSMATGHRSWFGTKKPLPENRPKRGTAPQGGLVASANDLARYLQMMMNGHDDVLSAEGKSAMMRPASRASPFYGLGWFVDPGAGTVWHSGTSPGYESLATMLPSERAAVVVLVNAGSGIGFGETTQLRTSITAAALGRDYDGEGSRLSQKALFVSLVLLPFVYALSMIWAWRHRSGIRAKSGLLGAFSLWFPLITTLAAAWVTLHLMPTLLGTPLGNITLFQPDLGVALIATAVTGVLWAAFRLAIAYADVTGWGATGESHSARPHACGRALEGERRTPRRGTAS